MIRSDELRVKGNSIIWPFFRKQTRGRSFLYVRIETFRYCGFLVPTFRKCPLFVFLTRPFRVFRFSKGREPLNRYDSIVKGNVSILGPGIC